MAAWKRRLEARYIGRDTDLPAAVYLGTMWKVRKGVLCNGESKLRFPSQKVPLDETKEYKIYEG